MTNAQGDVGEDIEEERSYDVDITQKTKAEIETYGLHVPKVSSLVSHFYVDHHTATVDVFDHIPCATAELCQHYYYQHNAYCIGQLGI